MATNKANLPFEEAPADLNAGDYRFDVDFVHRLQHWLHGVVVTEVHVKAVQVAVCFQAMSVVKQLGQLTVTEQELRLLSNYNSIVKEIVDEGIINPNLTASFKKMKGAQHASAITGLQIHNKFMLAAKVIRNAMMPKLPVNIGQLNSGTSLRDAFGKCLLLLYKEKQLTMTAQELAALTIFDIPPEFMWMAQPKVFFLCLQVFYFDLELTSDLALAWSEAKGVNRVQQKKMKQEDGLAGVKRKADLLDEAKEAIAANQSMAALTQARAIETIAQVAAQQSKDGHAVDMGCQNLKSLGSSLLPSQIKKLTDAILKKTMANFDSDSDNDEETNSKLIVIYYSI